MAGDKTNPKTNKNLQPFSAKGFFISLLIMPDTPRMRPFKISKILIPRPIPIPPKI